MNDTWAQQWATGADGWIRNERIFDRAFRDITAAILNAAELAAGQRVLDIGCGTGTLLEAAARAGAAAIGVDVSEPMVQAAGQRVPTATVIATDAQTTDLHPLGPFDRLVSRFGVMFFDDPTAAFTNLRAAAAPEAHLAFACWRDDEHDMFRLGLGPLLRRMATPASPTPPNTPGPLGLADPERTRSILEAAGWTQVAIEPVDVDCAYGDSTDGVEERLAVALSGVVGRTARSELQAQLGTAGWDALLDEARSELRARIDNGCVRHTGHIWIVTAKSGI